MSDLWSWLSNLTYVDNVQLNQQEIKSKVFSFYDYRPDKQTTWTIKWLVVNRARKHNLFWKQTLCAFLSVVFCGRNKTTVQCIYEQLLLYELPRDNCYSTIRTKARLINNSSASAGMGWPTVATQNVVDEYIYGQIQLHAPYTLHHEGTWTLMQQILSIWMMLIPTAVCFIQPFLHNYAQNWLRKPKSFCCTCKER